MQQGAVHRCQLQPRGLVIGQPMAGTASDQGYLDEHRWGHPPGLARDANAIAQCPHQFGKLPCHDASFQKLGIETAQPWPADEFVGGKVPHTTTKMVVAIEVWACVQKWRAPLVHRLSDGLFTVHVQHDNEQAIGVDRIEVLAELRQRHALAIGIDQTFVRIDAEVYQCPPPCAATNWLTQRMPHWAAANEPAAL